MNRTKDMVFISVFAILIAVGAFIKIPIPVVPFTLQYLFTMLSGLMLGGRRGFLAVMLYIVIGLVGVPVFASGGGIDYIFNPSFGYLVGFAFGSLLTGYMVRGDKLPKTVNIIFANLAGLMVVYAVGMVYYYLMSNLYLGTPIGLWPLFLYCFLLAVPGDIALCILAAFIYKKLFIQIKEKL